MIDYNTATAQECADWLHKHERWEWDEGMALWVRGDGKTSTHTPYPLTLDGAAGALREPWRLVSLHIVVDRVDFYQVLIEKHNGSVEWKVLLIDGPDRLTAEYRAAVAARLDGMEGRG